MQNFTNKFKVFGIANWTHFQFHFRKANQMQRYAAAFRIFNQSSISPAQIAWSPLSI